MDVLLTATALFLVHCGHVGASSYDAELAKFERLRVDGDNYDAVKSMHLYLYNNAVKALVGHMGRRLYDQIGSAEERHMLAACLDKVEDRNELVAPAKCIATARERFVKGRKVTVKGSSASNPYKSQCTKGGRCKYARIRKPPADMRQAVRQSIDTTDRGYPRLPHKAQPVAYEAGVVEGLEMAVTDAADEGRFASPIDRPQQTTADAPAAQRAKPLPVKTLAKLERLKDSSADKSPISRVADLVRGFLLNKPAPASQSDQANSTNGINTSAVNAKDPNWRRTFEMLKRVKAELDEKMRMPGAMVGERRMYDLVLGHDKRSLTPGERASAAALVNNAIDAISNGLQRNGDLRSGAKHSQKRTLSPRLMPIMAKPAPSTIGNNEILSPTLFALYDDDDDDDKQREPGGSQSIAPMPELLKAVGVSESDRSKIISTLIDVSGTTQFVDNALSVLRELNFLSPEVNGPLIDAHERMIGAFDALEASFAPRQRDEFSHDGLTFVGPEQLERLFFRDLRVLNFTEGEVDLAAIKRFGRMSSLEREETLWATIGHIARNESLDGSKREKSRVKRQQPIKWLSVNEPVVLSPYAFSPSYGLSVLGPLVLSPFVFSPLILNPSVISPWILSPALGAPYILSPYVFGPFILSPYGMVPFILSPYVLSPNILSPSFLSPMILSPIAISPSILSPSTLNPSVLSPTLLSPSILSNSSLSDAVLSPSFLSRRR